MWIPLTEFERCLDREMDESMAKLIETLQIREGAELLHLATSLGKPRLVIGSYDTYDELSPEIYLSYNAHEYCVSYSPAPLPKYKQRREVSAYCKTRNIDEVAEYFDLLMIRLQNEIT